MSAPPPRDMEARRPREGRASHGTWRGSPALSFSHPVWADPRAKKGRDGWRGCVSLAAGSVPCIISSPAALGRCSRLCLRVFATTVSRVEGGFSLPCVLAGELKTPTGLGPCKRGSCPCPARVTCSGQLSPFCTALVASGRPGCVQAGTLHRVPFAPVPECYRLTNKDSHAALCCLLYHGRHHPVTE